MNTTNFSQNYYKLDADNMIIVTKTLAELVRESAEETTSPNGVEPKLHIEECNNGYELRMWDCRGKSSLVHYPAYPSSFVTKDEAEQAWLEITYEYDFMNSEESWKWFESEEEAINDYVEFFKDECDDDEEEITVDSIKLKIEDVKKEIEESKKATAINLELEVINAYNFWKEHNCITKKAGKLIDRVKYSGYYMNGIYELYISYRDIATIKTMDMINEMTK